METPDQVGGKPKTASNKGMIRCARCGAKNRDSFEYCVRCSEPLVAAGPGGSAPSESRSPVLTLVLVALGLIVAIGAFAIITGSRSQGPAASASTTGSPAAADVVQTPRAEDAVLPDSREALALFNAGLAAFNQRDYALAVQHFSEVVSEIPDNPSAHQYLGLAHYHEGDFEDAMDSLEQARELRPESYELLDHYVTASKKAGDLNAAIEALDDFVADNPGAVQARLELARLARESGNTDLAVQHTEELARSGGASTEMLYEYAVSLKDSGDLEQAKELLETVVQNDPDAHIAQHALGVTEMMRGNPGAAVDSFEAAVANEPDNGDYRFSLAQAYEKADRVEDSLAAYEEYLAHASDNDPRAPVVRRQLEVAKKALAERQRARSGSEQSL